MSWSWTVPFAPQSVRAARREVAARLVEVGIPSPTVDDAQIVLSEVLANAIRHARPLQDGGLRIELEVEDRQIRLSVRDGGSSTLPMVMKPPELAAGGRGLTIVHSLTRTWGVLEGDEGNTVYGVLAR